MKNVLCALSVFCIVGALYGDIEFGSESALLRVNAGGRGVVVEYNPAVPVGLTTGRIRYSDLAVFNGVPLEISAGVLEESTGVYATVSNVRYLPALGSATITMRGASLVDAVNRFKIVNLVVQDPDGVHANVLAGAPYLVNPITLGANIGLICRLSAPLTKSIVLNGGTVTLQSHLMCLSDVSIAGTGSIDTGAYALTFGESYNTSISSNIDWISATTSIKLKGNIALSGDWVFHNAATIDGDSAIIDLSAGGSITIKTGARVVLSDLLLKGVTAENLIFEVAEGQQPGELVLDGVRIDLSSSLSFSSGLITVSHDSMLVLRDYNLSVINDAVLSVERATLSLNVLSNTATPYTGTVIAPNPLYTNDISTGDRAKNLANMALNITAGNLVIASGGAIVEVSAVLGSGVGSFGESSVRLLDQSGILSLSDGSHFTGNAVIDGGGAKIVYSRSSTPQFIIDAGVTVRISNVELSGINNNTFQLGDGAILEIGSNVHWTLAENITWSAEQIKLIGTGNSFEISSDGPMRTLHFSSPSYGDPHDPDYAVHLALGANAVVLRNVTLKGLRHITHTTEVVNEVAVAGCITLGGDAAIEMSELVSDHVFTVEGLQNTMRLCVHEPTFTGMLRFDRSAMSALTFSFITPSDSYRAPILHFYDGFMNLSSAQGTAYCMFDVPSVTVTNHALDAFILGDNSVLAGTKVTVANNSIAQTSARATIRPGLQLLSTLDTGALSLSTTLLDSMRGMPLRKVFPARFNTAMQSLLTRGVSLPSEETDAIIKYDSAIALPVLAGNVILHESYGHMYTNGRVSDTRGLNLTLADGVEVVQADVATTVKASDIINIVGGSLAQPNTFKVGSSLTFNGSLMLDDDAVFCVEFPSSGAPATFAFGVGSTISFGQRSVIVFKGNGFVAVPAAFTVPFGTTGSTIILEKNATLLLASQEVLSVSGVGTLLCRDGGKIIIESGSKLYCGTGNSDVIVLSAKNGGTIQVGDVVGSSGLTSLLTLAYGDKAIDCSGAGQLVIAKNGICECNANNGIALSARTEVLDFSSGGLFYLDALGELRVGANTSGQGIDVLLNGARIGGSGLVSVVGTSFSGRIQQNFSSGTNMTAIDLVRLFVQKQTGLLVSTLFTDVDNNTVLRTLNGQQVVLQKNDVIVEDSNVGKVDGYNALNGRRFSYNANGVRQ